MDAASAFKRGITWFDAVSVTMKDEVWGIVGAMLGLVLMMAVFVVGFSTIRNETLKEERAHQACMDVCQPHEGRLSWNLERCICDYNTEYRDIPKGR